MEDVCSRTRGAAALEITKSAPMPILFAEPFLALVRGNPLVYVDAGARGGLEGPWARINDERLRVLAFEPDVEAATELSGAGGVQWNVAPTALWNKTATIPIHLAKTLSTSSVHAPNFPVLRRYAARHADPRETERIAHVPCAPLDSVLSGLGIRADFLKIDTQGAEYEILEGAQASLRSDIFAVITETWTVEAHAGQRLSGDVMRLMQDAGFTLFDLSVAAAWQRSVTDRTPLNGKAQITGLDMLFFREPEHFIASDADMVKRVKAAAIAELYGFADVAVELLQSCDKGDERIAALLEQVIADASPKPANPPGKSGFLNRLFRRHPPTPKQSAAKLHY